MRERDDILINISRKASADHYKEKSVLLSVESTSSIVNDLDPVKSGSDAAARVLEKLKDPSLRAALNLSAKPSRLSRIRSMIKHYSVVVLASIAIELVMISSFNFLEGFLLTQTTLAVGTSVYVLDSVMRR